MNEEMLQLKAVFPNLKRWYSSDHIKRYGELPLFWQDLHSWPNLRPVLKEFEQDSDRKRSNNHGSSSNTVPINKFQDFEERDPIEKMSFNEKRVMLARMNFEDVNVKLNNVVQLAAEAEKRPNRTPSPDPIYNAQGIRMNTREVRMRNKFNEQKKQYLDEMLRLKPQTSSGGQDSAVAAAAAAAAGPKLIQRKIYIPVKDFPGRNFIGLIIGPRGNTQKQLEQSTGCKIAIRGKGSVKAGRQGKAEDEVDELHVIVTGDTEDAVDKASDKVEELLRPLDDAENEHKQKQLRELAIYNGTYRDSETCHHCGEKGHKQWECPKKRAADAAAAANRANTMSTGRGRGTWQGQVQCRHCGERSHPSSDCPTLRYQQQQQPPQQQHHQHQYADPSQYSHQYSQQHQQPVMEDSTGFADFWNDVSGGVNPNQSSYMPPNPMMMQQAPPPQYMPPPPAYPIPPASFPAPPPAFPAPPPSFPEPPQQRYN